MPRVWLLCFFDGCSARFPAHRKYCRNVKKRVILAHMTLCSSERLSTLLELRRSQSSLGTSKIRTQLSETRTQRYSPAPRRAAAQQCQLWHLSNVGTCWERLGNVLIPAGTVGVSTKQRHHVICSEHTNTVPSTVGVEHTHSIVLSCYKCVQIVPCQFSHFGETHIMLTVPTLGYQRNLHHHNARFSPFGRTISQYQVADGPCS